MNLPPTTFVVVVIAILANVLILAAVIARARADRGHRFAEVEGYVSSSYRGDASEPMPSASGETWLPGDDIQSSGETRWAEADAWSRPAWPGTTSLVTDAEPAVIDEPETPELEPFELPEPTTLEQRGVAAADELDGDDAEMDDPEEDEGTMEFEDEGVDHAGEVDDAMDPDARDADDSRDDDDPPAADTPREPDGRAGAPIGRDPLTGMLDAAAFDEVMAHEEAREQRYGRPATVIVFELDGLTKLVDRLGPEPGDRIETALGDTIQRLARRADHVARLERGRYAVLLPETDEVAAINYVERIRRACDLWLESGAIAMRLAIGWASTSGDAGLSGAVRAATDRMRLEQRRNARSAGDVALDVEGRNGHEPVEAASGI